VFDENLGILYPQGNEQRMEIKGKEQERMKNKEDRKG
jgi:hypothetical protein